MFMAMKKGIIWAISKPNCMLNILAAHLHKYQTQIDFSDNARIVIYIRVRDVNFPARQLVSGTMAQPSA
jgi:hypothetical protein